MSVLDKTINNLTAGAALTGAENVPISQSGVTVRTTTQDIANLGGGGTLPITADDGFGQDFAIDEAFGGFSMATSSTGVLATVEEQAFGGQAYVYLRAVYDSGGLNTQAMVQATATSGNGELLLTAADVDSNKTTTILMQSSSLTMTSIVGTDEIQVGLSSTVAGNPFFINCNGNRVVEIDRVGGANRIGFFGVTPVVKAAAPTTLANVITILTNLGLCS